MASVLICSIPAHGHVTPLLAVARAFVERGDNVRFLTGTRFAEKVAATGASHVPLPPDADYDESFLDQFPERAKLKGIRAGAFDIEHVFARPAMPQYDTLMDIHSAAPADVVLVDPAFTGALILLGHPPQSRPPVVLCGVVPILFNSVDTAPAGMGFAPARFGNRPRNAVLGVMARPIFKRANKIIDANYRRVHGEPLSCSLIDLGARCDAMVQLTVPAFEYPRSDAPTTLHFAGPVCNGGCQFPLPDWWADLDGGRPVVHVTQGTVANLDYRQVIAPTLRALADEDVLVVVSTGGRPLATLPPLPENARAATFLPYDELLPRTDVYVTNGGYGGVQHALRYGVPIVATGGKEDKPEVGARVAWSGVGRRLRTERPAPRALRRDILAVLRQPSYREASRRIAADMAAAPGFGCLAAVVDDLIAARRAPTRG